MDLLAQRATWHCRGGGEPWEVWEGNGEELGSELAKAGEEDWWPGLGKGHLAGETRGKGLGSGLA